MNLRRRSRNDEPDINLTPLIDVVFLLLIFFMVTTTFVHQTGLDITLPEADTERTDTPPDLLEISIDEGGEYYVAGEALVNRELDTLMRAIREALEDQEVSGVVIRADADAPHRALVRAMDGVGQLGISRVSIATIEPEQ
ncbi:biopolymer transport protein ExbD/TolR [Halorhodospira halochloris]|uniref:Biopolymer transport protein ExbD/TolR n=1 Tax=Halorhodospira halochloris TaxID=1052 RepID=A0A0X8X9N5_HALHR|nr:biopolymer transporter ExbD [Halorhodospira halochloris]MBK1652837.1 biopolymer transporter ExbD [Halorhodospira halochloris]BAU58057.1 biopolymer transport protein ExbD/TolR [Halorhodospira halochloris]